MHSHADSGALYGRKVNEERMSTSFKYVGPCEYVKGRQYNYLSFKDRTVDDVNIVAESLF